MSTVYFIPDDETFDYIGFDLTLLEDHKLEVTPTDNPIETGATVSDHVIKVPKTFSADVVVSSNPTHNTFYEGGSYVTDAKGVTTFQIAREANRIREAVARLEALQSGFITGTIVTHARDYESMLIKYIGLPLKTTGHAEIHIDWRELSVVNTQEVTAPKPAEPRGAPTQAKGAQTGVDATLKDLFGGDSSLLSKGWDYLGKKL